MHGEKISTEEKSQAAYLWNTGIVQEEKIFSPLFELFVSAQNKKEHMLFTYLEEHVNAICEREAIVDIVWPEYKEYGVSDWSIDRLVARVRGKLRKQKSMYEILTIRTRGYKLLTK